MISVRWRRLDRQVVAELADVDAAVHSVAYAALQLQLVRRQTGHVMAMVDGGAAVTCCP